MGLLDTIKSFLGLGSDDDDRRSDDVGVTVERDTRAASEPQTETETAVKAPADEAIEGETDEAVAAGTDATASTGSMVDESVDEPEEAAEPAEAVAVGDETDTEPVVDAESPETEEAVAAGTDASASTGSIVDENVADEAAEPAEAVDAAVEAIEQVEAERSPTTVTFGDQSATSRGDSGIAQVRETETEADTDSDGAVDGETDTAAEPAEAVDTDEGETVEAAEDDASDAATAEAQESPDVLKGIGPAYARRLADAGIETVAALAVADADEIAEAIDVSEKRVSRWITRAKEY